MSKFSVKKPLTVFVAVIAILVLGVVAYTKMTPDLLPNMDFPYVMIMTTYPGASPEKVEQEMLQRDQQDSTRAIAPLKQAWDAVLLDTSDKDIPQAVAALRQIVEGKIGRVN